MKVNFPDFKMELTKQGDYIQTVRLAANSGSKLKRESSFTSLIFHVPLKSRPGLF